MGTDPSNILLGSLWPHSVAFVRTMHCQDDPILAAICGIMGGWRTCDPTPRRRSATTERVLRNRRQRVWLRMEEWPLAQSDLSERGGRYCDGWLGNILHAPDSVRVRSNSVYQRDSDLRLRARRRVASTSWTVIKSLGVRALTTRLCNLSSKPSDRLYRAARQFARR